MSQNTIEYYFTPRSPWTYLGEPTLMALRERYGVEIQIYPVDIKQLFQIGGAVPLSERPLAKQLHREVELTRWGKRRQLPIHILPPSGQTDDTLACLWLTAARQQPGDGLAFAHAISRTHWTTTESINDPEVLKRLAREQGYDGETLSLVAQNKRTWLQFQQHTDRAIQKHLFGVPSYVFNETLFWGQDRLDFLEMALQDGLT